jgi:hypothetical protein
MFSAIFGGGPGGTGVALTSATGAAMEPVTSPVASLCRGSCSRIDRPNSSDWDGVRSDLGHCQDELWTPLRLAPAG